MSYQFKNSNNRVWESISNGLSKEAQKRSLVNKVVNPVGLLSREIGKLNPVFNSMYKSLSEADDEIRAVRGPNGELVKDLVKDIRLAGKQNRWSKILETSIVLSNFAKEMRNSPSLQQLLSDKDIAIKDFYLDGGENIPRVRRSDVKKAALGPNNKILKEAFLGNLSRMLSDRAFMRLYDRKEKELRRVMNSLASKGEMFGNYLIGVYSDLDKYRVRGEIGDYISTVLGLDKSIDLFDEIIQRAYDLVKDYLPINEESAKDVPADEENKTVEKGDDIIPDLDLQKTPQNTQHIEKDNVPQVNLPVEDRGVEAEAPLKNIEDLPLEDKDFESVPLEESISIEDRIVEAPVIGKKPGVNRAKKRVRYPEKDPGKDKKAVEGKEPVGGEDIAPVAKTPVKRKPAAKPMVSVPKPPPKMPEKTNEAPKAPARKKKESSFKLPNIIAMEIERGESKRAIRLLSAYSQALEEAGYLSYADSALDLAEEISREYQK